MFQFHLMSVHILRKSDDSGPFQPAKRYIFTSRKIDTGPDGVHDESATNYYDNGIVKADAVIAQLLNGLKHKGYLKNALVVITADHGESLGEHGLLGHANSVREELLRVPVVFIDFGYEPTRSIERAPMPLQIDIAPSILYEIGLGQPSTWMGDPMQRAGGEAVAYFEEHAYAGLLDGRERDSRWKYWVDRKTGIEHAFDLTHDPGEMRDEMANVPVRLRRDWRVQALSGTSLALRPAREGDNPRQSPTVTASVSSDSDGREAARRGAFRIEN